MILRLTSSCVEFPVRSVERMVLTGSLAQAATREPALGGLTGWAVGVMESLGGPGASLLVGLDNVFPPIPSELVLPLAGFTASQGTFSLAGALCWTTLGSVLGAVLVYLLGGWLGRDRTRALLARIPLLDADDFEKSEAWFARHGSKAVFFGRMVPVFRSFISLPAGVERMPLPQFLALTAAGSAIWNSAFVVAGYLLGENWHIVERYASAFQALVLGVAVLLVIWFVAARLRRRANDQPPR